MDVNVELSLDALKELVIRLVVGEHITRSATFHSDPNYAQIARHIESALHVATNEARTTGTVQAFVAARLATLRASILALIDGAGIRDEMSNKFSRAQAGAEQNTCSHCARSSGHQCAGNDWERDGRQLNEYGLCVSRITDLFDFIEAAVKREYTRPGEDAPSTTLKANVTRDRRGGVDPVSASTCFHDGPTGQLSVIDLTLAVERITWDAYATIPYTITHELICHAFQGSRVSTERVISTGKCQFAEGWMDYVAFTFFEDMLEPRQVASALPTADGAMLVDWIACGTRRHWARYDKAADQHGYSFGRNCAAGLEGILRSTARLWILPTDSAWPRKKLREFSIALNAVRDNSKTARAFDVSLVSLCRLIYESMFGVPDAYRDQALCDTVQSFCLDRDLDALVKSLRLLLQRFNYLR